MNIEKLIEEYNSGLTCKQLATQYGFKTGKSISDRLINAGVKLRNLKECKAIKKIYDENMFSSLDEYWKAYFLGLLYTDGYVVKRVQSNSYCIGIDQVDFDCINFLSQMTKKNYIICKSRPTSGVIANRDLFSSEKYRITFDSLKIAEDLFKFGIFPNKTYTCFIPEHLYNHSHNKYIMRGIIDGDGWIRKDGKEFFISSASEKFLQSCKAVLELLGMSNLKISKKEIKNYADHYILRTALQCNIEVLKQIYDTPFGMNRKYLLVNQYRSPETTIGTSNIQKLDDGIVQTTTVNTGLGN